MACPEQREWLINHTYVEFIDYHRQFTVPVEFISLVFIFTSAVFLNVATISAILRVQSLREKLGNWLIINLCVMDLITSLGNMLFSLIDIFNEGYLLCHDVICWINGGLTIIGCFGNFAAIILIAVHRFLTIVTKDGLILTSKHISIMITGCWIFILGVVIPLAMWTATMEYTHGNHHCSPYWRRSCPLFFGFVMLMYVATLVTMIICYSAIYWKVRLSRKRLVAYTSARKMDDNTAISKEHFSSTAHKGPDLNKTEELEDIIDLKRQHVGPDNSSGVTVPQQTTYNQEFSEQFSTAETSGTCQSVIGNVKIYKAKRKNNRTHDIDVRIACTGILLVLTTTICWAPFFVVNSCTKDKQSSHAVTVSVMWLAYSNSALDPIIYSALNIKLREAILKQVRLLWSGLVCRKR